MADQPEELTELEKQVLESKDEALMQLVRKHVSRTMDHDKTWETESREDYRFGTGDQWTDEERGILQEQSRPCLTIDKIGVQLEVLSGYQRNNSGRIKVSPEGAEDKVFSEIADHAIAHVDKVGLLEFKMNQQFDDGLKAGSAKVELAIDHDKDPLNGDLMFRMLGPWAWRWDPDSREYDHSDAEFGFKYAYFSKDRLKKLYPKKASMIAMFPESSGLGDWMDAEVPISEGDRDNYGERYNAAGTTDGEDVGRYENKHLLVEYYYPKQVSRWFIYDIAKDGLAEFEKKEDAEARIKELVETYSAADPATGEMVAPDTVQSLSEMEPIERHRPEMQVVALCFGHVLEKGPSPLAPRWQGWPVVDFLCKWSPSAECAKNRIQGFVRRMKDPQREINKARSQYLHVLNTSANSGWIGDEEALPPEKWKDLEEFGARPGIVIKKRTGTMLERLQPTNPDMAQHLREKTSTENLKEVTGVNADLLAFEDKNTSGKAIALRIKQALTIVASIFDNWKLTKRLMGEMIFKLLPEVMDSQKLAKIVGQTFMQENGIDEGVLQGFLTQVEDGRYDIAIHEVTDSPTLRTETFEQLLEISGKTPLPPKFLLEWSTIPNTAELLASLDKHLKELQGQQTETQ